MRRFFLKCALIFMPLIVWTILEVTLVPMGYFNFRAWETLSVAFLYEFFPANQYPNQTLETDIVGNAAYRTELAVPQRVRWELDRYGFRKRDSDRIQYPILILGDSSVAGASLTQEDILSEQLERRIAMPVYPYATATPNDLAGDERFIKYPPRVLIICYEERRIFKSRLPDLAKGGRLRLSYDHPLLPGLVYVDRILKQSMIRYLWARLRDDVRRADVYKRRSVKDPRRVFMQGLPALEPVSEADYQEILRQIDAVLSYFEGYIPHVIFMPLPTPENIFYDHIIGGKKPVMLKRLIADLRERNKKVIDLQTQFELGREHGVQLYQLDDPHWDASGVALASQAIAALLQEMTIN